jgi:hypothetical protein
MSLLTVVLVLAMLLWALGFVVSGLVLAEDVLWRRPGGQILPPISRTRKFGAMFLLVIGGILVVTAIVTGVLVAEREAHLVRLEATVSRLEDEVQALKSKLTQELSVAPRPPVKSP